MSQIETPFTKALGIDYPILCGAMFPCSNPELVAAASKAGGIGIVQPLSLVFVHGYECRAGLRYIRSLTDKPYGFNVIVEKSQKIYQKRMSEWVDIALEEGCRFFITALGNPSWVIERVKPAGAIVYHDVTEKKWAEKALECGVDGLICVNNRAGGHAGTQSPAALYQELAGFKVPLICAGGVGDEHEFQKALNLGYAGVQMGTRFIATPECKASDDYKKAILDAEEKDIVLTERATSIPISVINTPWIQQTGTQTGFITRFLLRHRAFKHWVRTWYSFISAFQLRHAVQKGFSSKDYFQAGRSVSGIRRIEPVGEIIKRFVESLTKP